MKTSRFAFFFYRTQSAQTTKGLLSKLIDAKKSIFGLLLKELPTRSFPKQSCKIPVTLFPCPPPNTPPPTTITTKNIFRTNTPYPLPTNVIMNNSMNMRSLFHDILVLGFMRSYIIASPTDPTRQRDDLPASERVQTKFCSVRQIERVGLV